MLWRNNHRHRNTFQESVCHKELYVGALDNCVQTLHVLAGYSRNGVVLDV